MIHRILIPVALALAGALSAQAEPAAKADAKAPPAFLQRPTPYPLTKCVVSGEDLDKDAVTFTAGGTTFRTCCEKCQAKVEKDPASFAPKVEAAMQAAQLAHYPLKTCVISGEELGSMGKPVQLMLEGTLVQLCCKQCVKKAQAQAPQLAQKVVAAAHDAQRASYPLDTCVVSGEKLDKDAVDVMFGTTLVRLCCEKCLAKIEKDPAAAIAKVEAALAKKPAAGGGADEKPKDAGGSKPKEAGGK